MAFTISGLIYFLLQVSELKKKQDAQAQLLRQKQKSDEAARRLQDEIHRIKTQKVQFDCRGACCSQIDTIIIFLF